MPQDTTSCILSRFIYCLNMRPEFLVSMLRFSVSRLACIFDFIRDLKSLRAVLNRVLDANVSSSCKSCVVYPFPSI